VRERLIEQKVVEHIAQETMRNYAQKNALKPWLKKMWCLPPREDARFVSAVEDVLEVYARPFCLDEAAKQLLADVREPVALRPGREKRYDSEYERRGTCALFMLFEPLAARRFVAVRKRRAVLDYVVTVRWV
jgi:hypothetical protein